MPRQLFRSFRASRPLRPFTRGDAPHVVRRLPLAFIFRAFGACRWLSYSAFGALPLAFIFRAFGACRWLSYSAFGALPLAFIFRAFGACPWLSYSAPSALALAFIFRAFGAQFRLCARRCVFAPLREVFPWGKMPRAGFYY